jgi:rhamnulokinase
MDTGQTVPEGAGELARCILESIALKTALVLEDICEVAKINPTRLHLGGGGARNELLCQIIAGATVLKVVTGPIEAAAVGNAIVQAVALGEIPSISEGANIVSRSLPMKSYEPANIDSWRKAKKKFVELHRGQK